MKEREEKMRVGDMGGPYIEIKGCLVSGLLNSWTGDSVNGDVTFGEVPNQDST